VCDSAGQLHVVPDRLWREKLGTGFTVDTTCTYPGADLGAAWFTQWWLGSWESFEPDTYATFARYVTPTSVVLDIGAWIGPTCLWLAARAGRVVALEPDPEAFRVLIANLRANPALTTLAIANVALAPASGAVVLYGRGDLGRSLSTILAITGPDGAPNPSVVVPAASIEEVETMTGIVAWDLVKMDIEGGEVAVLPALRDWLTARHPVLLLSIHPSFLPPADMAACLDTLYAIFPVVRDALTDAPLARTALTTQTTLVGTWT
jgi:FkbM family methyltransferase